MSKSIGSADLKFTLEERDYFEAQELLQFWLTNSAFFQYMRFIAIILAVIGIDLYVHGLRVWPLSLWGIAAGLLWFRMIHWPWMIRRRCRRKPHLLGPFQIVINDTSLSQESSHEKIEMNLDKMTLGHEAPHLFILVSDTGKTFLFPKRIFWDHSASQIPDEIRSRLKRRKKFKHRSPFGVKRLVEGFVSATVVTLFAGDLDLLAGHAYDRLAYYLYSNKPDPVPIEDLHGRGEVFLVPIGKTPAVLQSDLIQGYQQKYGVAIKTLAPLAIPEWARDPLRHQLIAEELVEAMKYAFPEHADQPSHILIGVTDEDLYITGLARDFAFNVRAEGRFAVISTARLTGESEGRKADGRVEERFRKLLTKNLGLLYFRMERSDNPYSVLSGREISTADLDFMADDLSRADAKTQSASFRQEGDPCITFHRHFAAEQTPADQPFFSGCSSFNRQLNVEVMEVNLRQTYFVDRRTEFILPDRMPLEFTRIVRNRDLWSRDFGYGGNHSLDIFPVGDTWPFTWIDLLLEDGARVHYKRANLGLAYWDAVYLERGNGTTEFTGSTLSWAFPGWEIKTQSGRKYRFPDGNVQRPPQAALLDIRDGNSRIEVRRDPSGDVLFARSPNGTELRFQYDTQHRITRIEADNGDWRAYKYDERGYLSEAASPNQLMEYRRKGKKISIFENGDPIFSGEFEDDRLDGVELPNGRVDGFEVPNGRMVGFELPNGRAYRFDYKDNETVVSSSDGHVIRIGLYDDSYTLEQVR